MNFDQMPPDPFADDPNDPAALLRDFGAEEDFAPLTMAERQQIMHDLALVEKFQRWLQPRGIRGVFFMCEDCEEVHYYDWSIMAENMRATLANELSPVHEPSVAPEVDAYVPWEYAVGYLDGLMADRPF